MTWEGAFAWANLYIAIPLALIGFGFTVQQARSARKAAEDASSAASAAEVAAENIKASVNNTLTTALLHKLDGLEADLESSVFDGNRRLVTYQLMLWRRGAGEFRAFLGGSPEDLRLKRSIQASIKASVDAKDSIMDPAADLKLATAATLRSISVVTGQIGSKSVDVLNRGI